MERHIKRIWKEFKSLKMEAFYLFCEQNGTLDAYKISKNETEDSGEIDVAQLLAISSELKGKKVLAVHNHPNGLPTPSFPDLFQNNYVFSLLALCNIEMEDYGIVSPYGYISFRDSGLLNELPPFTYYESTETIEPNVPFVFLSKDIDKNKALFLASLKKTPEILLNNKEQYGAFCFSGDFLLSKRRDFVSKNILFYGRDFNENKERLRQLDSVLEPFEIYGVKDDDLIPLKLCGFL